MRSRHSIERNQDRRDYYLYLIYQRPILKWIGLILVLIVAALASFNHLLLEFLLFLSFVLLSFYTICRSSGKRSMKQIYEFNVKDRAYNVGLENIGNTCYMNSALQPLHKTYQLTKALRLIPYHQKTPFLKCYEHFEQSLSKEKRGSYDPSRMKHFIQQYNPSFEGKEQQDSCQLLLTVLNKLDQDLNQVKKPQIYRIQDKIRSLSQLYAEYMKKDRKRSYSLIDQIFIGRFKTVYQCLECKNQKILFEKYTVIYLPIPNQQTNTAITLQDCMKQFSKAQLFQGDNCWPCKKCQRQTPTRKSMDVYRANDIVIFCLKRFNNGKKINKNIEYPKKMSLSSITEDESEQRKEYKLYGVVCHSGSLKCGHYISYCLLGYNWKLYNDSSVRQVTDDEQVHSQDALILFYRRIQ